MFPSIAAITKARVLYANMLKREQLLNIARCKNVAEIADFLASNTYYKTCISHLNLENIHRGQLEILINKHKFENYKKISRYAPEDSVHNFIMESFEIAEILRFVMFLKLNKKERYIPLLPNFLISKCKVKFLKLEGVKGVDGLLEFLKNTHYYNILKSACAGDDELSYTVFEYELYKYFFSKLLKFVNFKTKNIELFELNKLIKSKIDNINLCYVYREKILANCNAEQIKKRIFPFHKKLNSKTINNIINCKNKDYFGKAVGSFFPSVKDFKIEDIEIYSQINEYKICKSCFHMSSNIATVFYCFLVLQNIEVQNLTHIIEGVRYGMPPEKIENLLVV